MPTTTKPSARKATYRTVGNTRAPRNYQERVSDVRRARATLDEMLAAVRAGKSRSLVVRWERGNGSTEWLGRVSDAVSGFRVTRVVGVESDKDLAFAAVHHLCAQLLDRVDRLSEPQRQTLREAFAPTTTSPDPVLVGKAVFSLLSHAAREQPLVCVIEDAQWLDHRSARALQSVVRQLGAESIALVIGVRGSSGVREFVGIPERPVADRRPADGGDLLTTAPLRLAG